MLRSYVCRQCRSRLHQRIAPPRIPQWQPRATFISLRNGVQAEEKSNVDGQPPAQQTLPPESGTRIGRYSRNKGVQPAEAEVHVEMDADPNKRPSPARAINNLLDETNFESTARAWELFLEEYPSRDTPALTNPSYSDVPLLTRSKVFDRLARFLTAAYCNDAAMPATPTEVLFKLEQLGMAPYGIWRSVIGDMTDQLLWGINGTKSRKMSPEGMLYELVSVWRLFFQCKGREPASLESISSEWKGIPDVSAENGVFSDPRFGVRLTDYHPGSISSIPLQFSAITLFNLFDEVNQEVFKVPQDLRDHAAPFTRLITYLLCQSNVEIVLTHEEHSTSFQRLPEDFRASVLDQVRSAPYQAMRVSATQQPNRRHKEARSAPKVLPESAVATSGADSAVATSGAESAVATPGAEAEEPQGQLSLEDMFRKRIARAVISQSHARVLEKLWSEARAVFKNADDGKIPLRVYNAFLNGFMALLKPDRTIEVWNHMISAGIEPEMRTWVAMLDGCSKARDVEGLNAIWDRMIKSGIEPDDYAWTTRIHGLFSQRQFNLAMNAIDEMGRRYMEAANPAKQTLKSARKLPTKTATHASARPSVEIVNASISALINLPVSALVFSKKIPLIQRVLQWGKQFGIKPDVYTYNNLIKLYSRENDATTTFKILRQMEAEGIEGDSSTYSMLISAAFSNNKLDHLSPSEQTDFTMQIFDELEAGGFKLNARIYSGPIDRLLKLYANVPAALAVMNRMAANNVATSPPIYTSLITHCFQQQPPDIASVDAIVARIFSPPKAQTDKYLFDRIIEGYAVNGEIDSMMKVLAKMDTHGKLPAFASLTEALRALVKAGDWERARMIVRDVQTERGVAKGGPTGGRRAMQDFMFVARSAGILLEESFAGEAMRNAPVKEEARDGAPPGPEDGKTGPP